MLYVIIVPRVVMNQYKATFTVCINLKEPFSVFNIILQRGTYDITTVEAIKSEHDVSIPLGFLCMIPSSNYKISYTLVSLINHGGDSLDYGHYVSDVFDTNTDIW